MKKFITIFAITMSISACSSFDPYELQLVRVQCSNENHIFKTSVENYYNCVQSKTPFGAYKEKIDSGSIIDTKNSTDKKNKAKTLINNSSLGFSDDIDFLYAVPLEDRTWLMMDLAVSAIINNEIKLSHHFLEQVAANVETIYGNSKQAKKARAAFSHEAEKIFIGEIHERAMVFHYLGLLDLVSGDYQNARAAFKASFLQDSIARDKEYEGDFASSIWLQGWAAHCARSRQSNLLFDKAKNMLDIPPAKKNHNLVVVLEIGQGPFKLTQGEYGEKLIYANMPSTKIENSFQPTLFNLFKANNIHFQAVTRGNRSFDDYLESKASNKQAVESIAESSLIAGLIILDAASSFDDPGEAGVAALVGLGTLAVSGIATAIGEAINPAADTRTWRALPREIYLGSFQVPANTNSFSKLKTSDKNLLNLISYIEKNKRAGLVSASFYNSGKCSILWAKDISTH